MDATEQQLDARISADLVERIGRGERSAEAELFERYGRGVLYLLKRRTRDVELALDLRQDAFRIAIEKLRAAPLEEPERLGAYLRGIAVNLVIGHQRKSARRATTPDSDAIDLVPDDRQGPFDDVSSEQAREAVRSLLDELPVQRDRELLVRFYLEEEDKDAICAGLGVTSEHFNRVLFRAKGRFRELLEKAAQKGRLRLVR